MRSKILLITTVFLFMLQLNIKAATIYASDGSEISNNSNICANDTYYYQVDSASMYEAEVIATSNNMLLDTFYSSNSVLEFVFPANVEDLSVYIFEYTNSDRKLVDKVEFSISDCGYEVITEDYKFNVPQTDITVDNNSIIFSEPTAEDYKLYINQLEVDDDGKSSHVKFKDGVSSIPLDSDVVQLTEEFKNNDGDDVTKYYEVDLSDGIIIRRLSNLELTIIEPLEYIDVPLLIRTLLGLIILVVLYLVNILLVKQLRAKKEYKLKLKKIKERRRQKVKEAKKAELELKRQKQIARNKERQESERRANLEIRK